MTEDDRKRVELLIACESLNIERRLQEELSRIRLKVDQLENLVRSLRSLIHEGGKNE